MKKIVKAQITCITYEYGGRKNPPLTGTRYCPIVIFNNVKRKSGEFWSADFVCTEVDENLSSIVEFSFLSEDAPMDYLVKGNEFELFEGNKKVASGVIIE